MLNLQPGEVVLDVGSGIGGNAFQMAQVSRVIRFGFFLLHAYCHWFQEFGAHVVGVDLSSNMVSIASERANTLKDPRVMTINNRQFRILKKIVNLLALDSISGCGCNQVWLSSVQFWRDLQPGLYYSHSRQERFICQILREN